MLSPEILKHIWDIWNVRAAIFFSFLLQLFLVLFAPFRKSSDSMLLQSFIWTIYMLADWAANFTMGLITNNIGGDNNDATQEILMAMWAPFVLLHFGGPDTITAFSLVDNHLWLRQVPSLMFQVGASAYVLIHTLTQNTMWIPTLLVFVAGIIKCFERTRALFIASQTLGIMSMKSLVESLDGAPSEDGLRSHFTDPKLLDGMVPVQLLNDRLKSDGQFFGGENILEFFYERHYTKAPVLLSKVGSLIRFVAFSSIVVALGVFSSIEKTRGLGMWDNIDVKITYTLFCGAILLEIISLLMRATTWYGHRKYFSTLFPPWSRSISGHNLIRHYLSKCDPEKPYLCFKHVKFLQGTFDHILYSLGVKEILQLSKNKTKTTLPNELWPFIHDQGLTYLKKDTGLQDTLKQRIHSAAEGRVKDVVDNIMHHICIINPIRNGEEEYPFGRTLILLHIATTLCYANMDENFVGSSRHCSKLISDYMIYLLLMQPDMLSEVPGIEAAWTQETIVVDSISSEFIEFFNNSGLTSRDNEKKACLCVLNSYDNYNPSELYPTVLVLTRTIAQDLGEIPPALKWEAITKIWVQMLIFAASHCRPSIHVNHLPKGGELISSVWVAVLYQNWSRDSLGQNTAFGVC